MKQGVDWSDVVRASFGAVTKVEQAGESAQQMTLQM